MTLTESMLIRLTPAMKRFIRRAAKQARLSPSEWMRRLVEEAATRPRD